MDVVMPDEPPADEFPAHRWASVVAAGFAVAAAVVVAFLAISWPARAPRTGAVLDLTPDPSTEAATEQGAPGEASSGPPLTVESEHLEVWPDALGAWHGQAIARVRNDGPVPIELDPAAARAMIRDGATVVYAGALDAAVPPVLERGQAGYLVLGFPLTGKPAAPSVSIVPASVSATALANLRVDGAEAVAEPGRIVVTGTASNPRKGDVREGVVGAIAIDQAGVPLAAFLDWASLGRLDAGASRSFRATEPPAPPIRLDDIDDLVVLAWGRAERD
jgi:hypothetical protein